MTRETKIGLLVGLAFIIVIGILLSDHLTQTNDPQQAALAQVAGNVRTGVAVPGASATNPPPASVTPPTQNVAPQQQIPTREELAPQRPPVEIVQVGGGTPPQQPHAKRQAEATPPAALTPEQGVSGADSNTPIVARPVEPVNGSLNSVARTMGEELVPVDQTGTRTETPSRVTLAAPAPAGTRQYTAQPGDSLSKIASKVMGSASKANQEAIIAANPSLQGNANMVIAGRTYVIPGGSNAATPAPAPSRIAIVADRPPVAPAPDQGGSFYTVKQGDSLTKIAVEQCGSAAAVNAIIDLNKDVLKGGTVIRPNMKLRMPAKVASAE